MYAAILAFDVVVKKDNLNCRYRIALAEGGVEQGAVPNVHATIATSTET